MVAAFPAFKLGVLVVKQITKPLANSIAKRARSSKFFRERFCIPVAQLFHWYDVKVRMRILNLGKVTKVPKLDEKQAIDTGAQLLSEIIIFTVASGLLIFEYRRQSEKEEVKQREQEREKREFREKVDDISFVVEQQSAQIRELTRLTNALKDALENANKKNSSFFSFSGGKSENVVKEVNNNFEEDQNPITSAVLKLNLHSV